MYGRVYDCSTDDMQSSRVQATVSFGGLLARIEGPPTALRDIRFNQNIYLMMKRSN